MSLNEEVELLRNIPLFSRIKASKLRLLAFTLERLSYQEEQFLFNEGDSGDAAYIIINGAAAILIDTGTSQIEAARLKKGDVVGEIAILCDVPRTATVQAKDSLITLKITKERFFNLVTEFPEIAVEIMRELTARLERISTQLRDASSGKIA